MTPEDLLAAAQDFMSYYVDGAATAGGERGFPGSSFEGIALRSPAALDIRPEYTPLPRDADNLNVPAGVLGPEGPGPYLFVDRCPLRRVIMSQIGEVLNAELVLVTRYPPGTFPGELAFESREIRLPSDLDHLIAAEVLSQLEDCLGFDSEDGIPSLGFSVKLMTVEDFVQLVDQSASTSSGAGP